MLAIVIKRRRKFPIRGDTVSNFAFLQNRFPVLANLGNLAEKYLYSDANSCLIKLGMIGETIVNLIFAYDKLKQPIDDRNVIKINMLKRDEFIDEQIFNILEALRKARNKAAHDNYNSVEQCKVLIEFAYTLTEWFMQTYGDYTYQHQPFKLPQKGEYVFVYAEDNLAQTHKLMDTALNLASKEKALSKAKRLQRIKQTITNLQLTEAQTRYLIDEQLRSAGWEADSINLHYGKGTRPQKNHNLAIAEWKTTLPSGKSGRVDYALFIGLDLVGIIEAKAKYKDISSVIDYQCKEYAQNITDVAANAKHTYGNFKVPFIFATNGRAYLAQLATQSGIWFQDLRSATNPPKALQGFTSPDGLKYLLAYDEHKANQNLNTINDKFLQDPQGLNLRQYQLKAIEATRNAIINGQKNILLAMATGTGKTRTILGMIYLFLKTKRFHRILFLVDRTSLGEQAFDTFKEVKLEDLLTLNQLYDIKGLSDKITERETSIQIATIQSMIKRIFYHSSDDEKQTIPTVSDFDLIIIDEAHRGYVLDKQMDDDELLYANQQDYISKYSAVINYFDAVKIGLTATPALHTVEIFGNPVFTYSYREAVIDGYLVDHDVPHNIETKLRKEGIHYQRGDKMLVYDPVTEQILHSECLEDEIEFEVDSFNRKIITESFNQTVLTEIMDDILLRNSKKQEQFWGKVLIFAVDDKHADLVVKILKEICAQNDIATDTVMKITASAGEGNKERILAAIRAFKNERKPAIVVTVDLLTTGIDVPQIDTLVFLRRTKSRILFEQMLGRATRLCPSIGKTHFEIYDAVGVYEALDNVNTMKPVVANPQTTIADILTNLQVNETNPNKYDLDKLKIIQRKQLDQLIAKLRRQQKNLTKKHETQFKQLTGTTSSIFLSELENKTKTNDVAEALQYVNEHQDYLQALLKLAKDANHGKMRIISEAKDELLSHTRNYGNTTKPQDYIESFTQFIRQNMQEITTLNVICTKPSSLKRQDLKQLLTTLSENGYPINNLNTALNSLNNTQITSDIISIVRQCALGAAPISHEQRIKNAIAKLKGKYYFTKKEEIFLNQIENYLIVESVINEQTFNTAPQFKTKGGFRRINKVFNEKLPEIIDELNNYLYDDGGKIA